LYRTGSKQGSSRLATYNMLFIYMAYYYVSDQQTIIVVSQLRLALPWLFPGIFLAFFF